MTELSYHSYKPSHPWYYKLGGKPPTLKSIRDYAINQKYQGYLSDDIAKARRQSEPKRSEQLKHLTDNITADLWRDITIYRQLRRDHALLSLHGNLNKNTNICNDIHTSLSLKYNHLSNHFIHLHQVQQCLVIKQFCLF
jgi:hypothetical protein